MVREAADGSDDSVVQELIRTPPLCEIFYLMQEYSTTFSNSESIRGHAQKERRGLTKSSETNRSGKAIAAIGVIIAGQALIGLVPVSAVFAQETPPPAAVPPATAPGTAPAPETAQQPLTLGQLINLALRSQPSLDQAQALRDASAQRVFQARSTYYPSVAPSYTYTNNYSFAPTNQFVPTFDPVTGVQNGGSFVTVSRGRIFDAKQADISASVRIYDNTREFSNRQARQNLRATIYGTFDTRQAVIANVANSYFQALQNEALVRVAESQVARTRNTLEVVQAQVEVGVAARKDTFQAEADYQNAQVSLLQAQNNTQIAQAQLRNAIGIIGTNASSASGGSIGNGTRLPLAEVPAPTSNTPLTVDITAAAPAAAASVAAPSQGGSPIAQERPSLSLTGDGGAAIGQLLTVAYTTRPDVLQAQQSLEATKTSVRLRQVNAGLQFSADLGAGYQVIPTAGNNRQINVSATYPLFDGGLVRSQVREAQAGVRSSEAQLETLKQQIAVDIEQSFRSLALARASLPAALAAQQAAQINYDAALESRREGVGSIVEVITAQTALVQAQTNYVQAIYTFYGADAALARAIGQAERIGVNTPTSNTAPETTAPGAPATPAPTTPAPAAPPAPTTPEGNSGTP
jgi:outer membrane protein